MTRDAWCAASCLLAIGCVEPVASTPSDGGASPDASPAKRIGEVNVILDATSSTRATIFAAGFGVDVTTVLAEHTHGECSTRRYTQRAGTLVSAGTLTFEGRGSAVSIEPASNQYSGTRQGFMFSEGEQLTIAATGAQAPAFSSTLPVPGSVTLDAPLPSSVARTGLTVDWVPQASDVRLFIAQYSTTSPTNTTVCIFDGTLGTGSVPAAAFTEFSGAQVQLSLSTQSVRTIEAGEYEVRMSVIELAAARTAAMR